jgi:alanine dehydrogenase
MIQESAGPDILAAVTPAPAAPPAPLLYLGREEVEALLPMAECIEVMAETLRQVALGEGLQPLRSVLWLPDRRGLLGVMPGALGAAGEGLLGLKVVTVFPGNHGRGEETHLGSVLIFEPELGRPLAILDAATITAIRTAAVSAVATRALAREDAAELALLGSGIQASRHLAALALVRPLSRVRVWSRDAARARRFAAVEAERHRLPVEAVAAARDAVRGADLVCTVTSAREPVLAGDWIAPGAHVNAVGSCTPAARELDARAVARARLFVDRRESVLHEAGDFLQARAEGAVGDEHILGELGELLAGKVAGRRSAGEITLFESLGLAVEDLAAAGHAYRQALARGLGTRLTGEQAALRSEGRATPVGAV